MSEALHKLINALSVPKQALLDLLEAYDASHDYDDEED